MVVNSSEWVAVTKAELAEEVSGSWCHWCQSHVAMYRDTALFDMREDPDSHWADCPYAICLKIEEHRRKQA